MIDLMPYMTEKVLRSERLRYSLETRNDFQKDY